ncbi:MAG: hypothetical protein JXR48_01010 [Candidatus Delongbacteria bacterium]|nr:hypothetical protein [Candidatus Delongbacteria bacterium]MBN2833522.1 hypothetical protein [Candidatus Delongbacteria bacterium]
MLASLEEETCNFKHEKSDLSIKIKETRIIDQEISNLLNSLKSNDKEISELSNSISQVKKDLENCLENKNKTEKKLSEIELYLNTNILDEEIKGSLSGIEVSISELLKLNNRKKDVEKEILKENEKVDNNLDRLDFLNKNYFKKSELANNEKSKYDEIKKEIEIIESEHNMGELTQKIETVKSIINIFEDFNKVRSTIELNERLIHSIELSLAEANNNFDIVSNNYDRSVIELDLNEKNLDLMTQKQLLEKRVLDFELERAKLVNNLPCPLCGSLVHPFTDGIEIDLNSTKNEIDLLRETIKSSKGIQKKLLSQLNDFKSEIVKFENKKDELLRVLEKDKKYVKDVLEEFKLELLEVESFCNSKKSELDILKKIADNYFYLNSEIVKISEKIGLFDKDLNSELISIEKVKNELDNSQSSINEKNKLLMTLSEQIKTAGDELSLSLSKFNLKIPQNLDFRPLIEDLKSRENLYSFNYKTFLSKKEELNDLMKLESVFNEKVNIFSQDYSKLELNKHNLENTISKKRGERNYLFGNKNCDLVENELIVKEKKYNDSIELIKNEITKLIIQKEKTETLINSISEQIIAMKNSLHSEETLFIEKLKEQNFSNKEHYLRSTRTVEEITNLKNRSLELDEKKLTITNLIEDKNNKLLELNEIDITAEIETNEKIALDENKYSENKENLGRIKHILDEDSRIRKDNDLKMKIFNSMGKDLDDWEALHDLIGSADGKKFRNIAQGITFEQMVIIANQQLRKITDRYILVRSKIEPLDLNVIDNYQAGVVRSTKNLSGGESFLISLSLALGLSYMSGKKSSVDTLFLDEGFGTLDEDTLEIALSALNSIGQNGKLVGIISHVPILKERISTTINVIPKNLGKSLLEGPGVRAN